ncbi:hypothetical protein SAMN06309944_1007 [Micrococcales bacterium KH10]|nr:hypothetical protein SAMN06309944_1007 [Micrococcales bacterium KH10]
MFVDSPAGFVALAILLVWLAYFVPGRLARRERVAAARVDDRFSESLRVLAIAGGQKVETAPNGDCAVAKPRTTKLLVRNPQQTASLGRGSYMDQPEFSAARAALMTQRRQQARRRALLTALLGVITLALLPVVLLTAMSAWWLALPGGLLGVVLVLGRRAVVAQQRADAELARRARMAHRAELATRMQAGRPGARRVGRPIPVAQPRTARTGAVPVVAETEAEAGLGWSASVEEVLDRVDERRAGRDGSAGRADTDDRARRDHEVELSEGTRPSEKVATTTGRAVRPHRVPRPTYATKPAAPRWEPAPLSAEIQRATRAMAQWEAEHGEVAVEDDAVVVSGVEFDAEITLGGGRVPGTAAEQGTTALGDEAIYGVLERRRAVGE